MSLVGADLSEAPVVGEVIRQVIDLPRIEPVVTDLGAEGLACRQQAETAGRLGPVVTALTKTLAAEPTIHAGETGTRVRTTKHWVHSVTTVMSAGEQTSWTSDVPTL